LLSIYLLFFADKIKESNSVFKPLVEVRYMIVLMGFFAFYTGWIYNDFLSLSFNIFGSCYELNGEEWERVTETCTYPFGLDPVWGVAENELTFVNSFKMKVKL
jgi:V-type H+-transporting ATPase subunit a